MKEEFSGFKDKILTLKNKKGEAFTSPYFY
jgi:hypothetical protein